jgi:hypothetical protein
MRPSTRFGGGSAIPKRVGRIAGSSRPAASRKSELVIGTAEGAKNQDISMIDTVRVRGLTAVTIALCLAAR